MLHDRRAKAWLEDDKTLSTGSAAFNTLFNLQTRRFFLLFFDISFFLVYDSRNNFHSFIVCLCLVLYFFLLCLFSAIFEAIILCLHVCLWRESGAENRGIVRESKTTSREHEKTFLSLPLEVFATKTKKRRSCRASCAQTVFLSEAIHWRWEWKADDQFSFKNREDQTENIKLSEERLKIEKNDENFQTVKFEADDKFKILEKYIYVMSKSEN